MFLLNAYPDSRIICEVTPHTVEQEIFEGAAIFVEGGF